MGLALLLVFASRSAEPRVASTRTVDTAAWSPPIRAARVAGRLPSKVIFLIRWDDRGSLLTREALLPVIAMSIFDATQGTVTSRSVEKGPLFEVYQATQGDTPVGAIRFDWTRKGIMMQSIVGHGHGLYAALFVRHSETVLSYTGRIAYFSDFWDMPTYDTLFRTGETPFLIKHHAKTDHNILLTQSKLVAMGASVVSLATNGLLKTLRSRAEFESALAKFDLPSKRPMPR